MSGADEIAVVRMAVRRGFDALVTGRVKLEDFHANLKEYAGVRVSLNDYKIVFEEERAKRAKKAAVKPKPQHG